MTAAEAKNLSDLALAANKPYLAAWEANGTQARELVATANDILTVLHATAAYQLDGDFRVELSKKLKNGGTNAEKAIYASMLTSEGVIPYAKETVLKMSAKSAAWEFWFVDNLYAWADLDIIYTKLLPLAERSFKTKDNYTYDEYDATTRALIDARTYSGYILGSWASSSNSLGMDDTAMTLLAKKNLMFLTKLLNDKLRAFSFADLAIKFGVSAGAMAADMLQGVDYQTVKKRLTPQTPVPIKLDDGKIIKKDEVIDKKQDEPIIVTPPKDKSVEPAPNIATTIMVTPDGIAYKSKPGDQISTLIDVANQFDRAQRQSNLLYPYLKVYGDEVEISPLDATLMKMGAKKAEFIMKSLIPLLKKENVEKNEAFQALMATNSSNPFKSVEMDVPVIKEDYTLYADIYTEVPYDDDYDQNVKGTGDDDYHELSDSLNFLIGDDGDEGNEDAPTVYDGSKTAMRSMRKALRGSRAEKKRNRSAQKVAMRTYKNEAKKKVFVPTVKTTRSTELYNKLNEASSITPDEIESENDSLYQGDENARKSQKFLTDVHVLKTLSL